MTQRALEGIKVLEITQAIAGPLAGRVLADHGAMVVRVESAMKPDQFRTNSMFKDRRPGLNRNISWSTFNCSKLDLSMSLKHPRTLPVIKKLVAWADVLIENNTPGTMEDYGVGYQDVVKLKPDIIMMRISNMGQTGPYAKQPAYGPDVGAMCGFTKLTGWPDRPPATPWAGGYFDIIAARLAAATVMAALDYRRRTGEGQLLDISMVEADTGFLAPQVLDYYVNGRGFDRTGNRSSYAAPHGAYPCRGKDCWCAIAILRDEQWAGFCQAIGSPRWTKDARFATVLSRKEHEDELDTLVSEWTLRLDATEAMKILQEAGVPAGVVEHIPDICEDPQLEHRQHFWAVDNPEIGLHHCDSWSFKLSETPAVPRRGGPLLGQDNEYICKQILGMTEEEYVGLLLDDAFK